MLDPVALSLTDLIPCPANARPYDPEKDDRLAMLTASIKAHGLLQPIIVRETGTGFAVVAGQRRVAAIAALEEPDFCVLAVVLPADADATAISLAENYARSAMSMVDIYKAFRRIGDEHPELTVEQIGEQFGFDKVRATRIMRIANLAPFIMDKWESGEIDEAAAQAYASTADHERQEIAWKLIEEHSWWRHEPRAIKQALGFSTSYDTQRMLNFVGREAYEAAGGTGEEDLFGTEYRLDDEQLLEVLVQQQAQAELDAIRMTLKRKGKTEAEGAVLDFTWVETPPQHNRYGSLQSDYEIQIRDLKDGKLPAKGAVVGTWSIDMIDHPDDDEGNTVVTFEVVPKFWFASREDYNLAHPKKPLEVGKPVVDKPKKAAAAVPEGMPENPDRPDLTQRAVDEIRAQRVNMLGNHLANAAVGGVAQVTAHKLLIYSLARSLVISYESRPALGLVNSYQGARYTYQGTSTKPDYLVALDDVKGLDDRDTFYGFADFEHWLAQEEGRLDYVASLVLASKVEGTVGPSLTLVDQLFTQLADPAIARAAWTPNVAFFDLFKKDTVLRWIGKIHANFHASFAKLKVAELKAGAAAFFTADEAAISKYGIGGSRETVQAWVPDWLRWHTLVEFTALLEAKRVEQERDGPEPVEDDEEVEDLEPGTLGGADIGEDELEDETVD